MAHYTLIYFPIRGKAEGIRYILAYGGASYDDDRIPRDKWPEMKSQMPMGQVPVLQVDGKHLAQSMSIARFLAKKFHLVPENDWDAARADMMVDGVIDLYAHSIYGYRGQRRGQKAIFQKEAWTAFKTQQLPPFLDRYENFLKQNGTGFLIGNKLTWADIIVAEILNRMVTIFDTPEILSGHPNLVKLMKHVHEIPSIKKYVDRRPETTH